MKPAKLNTAILTHAPTIIILTALFQNNAPIQQYIQFSVVIMPIQSWLDMFRPKAVFKCHNTGNAHIQHIELTVLAPQTSKSPTLNK